MYIYKDKGIPAYNSMTTSYPLADLDTGSSSRRKDTNTHALTHTLGQDRSVGIKSQAHRRTRTLHGPTYP